MSAGLIHGLNWFKPAGGFYLPTLHQGPLQIQTWGPGGLVVRGVEPVTCVHAGRGLESHRRQVSRPSHHRGFGDRSTMRAVTLNEMKMK